ncbi:Two component system, signal transduction response regulator [Acididesulfobacillus acetoxydans]|uniref:Stage 0 sporulation protein A homolog n=1 Tax=Acididesulfobacillus acetoxydans TaxID=1561005 RepID=A0A8S0WW59_9FIRM|nr:sigma-54 dependent transcriptional regulator [Acididesulfobacillus acetoxydans]CAA7600061.1 Two component system, signal transduction response regulator [Acididesulfobacillus acetoxydans]CEJ07836.1 Acetoacetate metabolism regulatory protein AtoC [Acididesulfobacillus acetoxydans]
MPKVLIIDDELEMAQTCARLLRPLHLECLIETNGPDARERVKRESFDIILTDLKMPGCSGMEIVRAATAGTKRALVIVVTGFGSIDVAVEAIKSGAFDFLTKPFSAEQLRVCVEKALREIKLTNENEDLKAQLRAAYPIDGLTGRSPSIQAAFALIRKVAATDVSVLILGESGTGKELFARSIHTNSRRIAKPFVPIDCASLPENLLESELFGYEKGAFTGANQTRSGLIELAHGGTLFLDELGELGLGLQSKLLRVLQERTLRHLGGKEWLDVDIRVIAATNLDLEQAIKEKKFREDLYYRLNVVRLQLPPLRERIEDIPMLAREFLREANVRLGKDVGGIAEEALSLLVSYPWPGNIRQLKNAIERAVVLCETTELEAGDFAPDIQPRDAARGSGVYNFGREDPERDGRQEAVSGFGALNPVTVSPADLPSLEGSYREAKERWLNCFQEKYLKQLLEQSQGNISRAAQLARIDRRTIHRWLTGGPPK